MAEIKIPQYLRIAISIASKITEGQYAEGERLPGMTKLSSEYSVSAETIRKAVSLLEDMKIVQTREKSGVTVLSAKNAQIYLESAQYRREQYELRQKMQTLFADYQRITDELADVSDRLVAANLTPIPSEQTIPTFEVIVGSGSDKLGRTIGSIRFWQATGSTIIAIRRGQNLIVSPGPYEIFKENDVIVCAGREESMQVADVYLNLPKSQTESDDGSYHSLWATNINRSLLEELLETRANICKYLGCKAEKIGNVMPMQQGFNNYSFSFTVGDGKYVYRHPGADASSLVDRTIESKAMHIARDLGIDGTLLFDDSSGWKLARYVEQTEEFDFFNQKHVAMLASHIRTLNTSGIRLGHVFDYESEAIKLLDKIRSMNIQKYRGLEPVIQKIAPAFERIRKDAWPSSMCHNDLYEPNLLVEGDRLHIIDWEFAGDCDIGFDICKVFSVVTPEYDEIDKWLELYFERPVSTAEKLHLVANAAIIYYYWYVWALYADEKGENVSVYLTVWRTRMYYYIRMLSEHGED